MKRAYKDGLLPTGDTFVIGVLKLKFGDYIGFDHMDEYVEGILIDFLITDDNYYPGVYSIAGVVVSRGDMLEDFMCTSDIRHVGLYSGGIDETGSEASSP